MVTSQHTHNRRSVHQGMVMIELVVAMGILLSVMLPVAFSFAQEQRLARGFYYRAIAMEIVDGEMEVLMAGEWRAFPKGQQTYRVRGDAARNLPPGQFSLTIRESDMELQWAPKNHSGGGAVSRVGSLRKFPAEPAKAQR
jgi:hypothetical protein